MGVDNVAWCLNVDVGGRGGRCITRNGRQLLDALTVQQRDRVYASPNDVDNAISVTMRLPMLAKLKVRRGCMCARA